MHFPSEEYGSSRQDLVHVKAHFHCSFLLFYCLFCACTSTLHIWLAYSILHHGGNTECNLTFKRFSKCFKFYLHHLVHLLELLYHQPDIQKHHDDHQSRPNVKEILGSKIEKYIYKYWIITRFRHSSLQLHALKWSGHHCTFNSRLLGWIE